MISIAQFLVEIFENLSAKRMLDATANLYN